MSSISTDFLEKLAAFFNKIADSTVNHSVIEPACTNGCSTAVYPRDLGELTEALECVGSNELEYHRGPGTVFSWGNNDKK